MEYTNSEIEEAYNNHKLFVVAQRDIIINGDLYWIKDKRYKIFDVDYEKVWQEGWMIDTEDKEKCLIEWKNGDFKYLIEEECLYCIWTEDDTIPKDKSMCDECYEFSVRINKLSKSFNKSEVK